MEVGYQVGERITYGAGSFYGNADQMDLLHNCLLKPSAAASVQLHAF